MDVGQLTRDLKQYAAEIGFALCGVCPAVAPPGVERLDQWLAAGYAGQMEYLSNRREAYNNPDLVLQGARSIVMLAMNYRTSEPEPSGEGRGRVSRYAWGELDYHDLIRERLDSLGVFLKLRVPHASIRGVVDTAPLLEREFAQLAGLGWTGKNTLLINRHAGSWFFLAAILTDLELKFDSPHETDHCGSCRACLDACPTNAFPQPYVLDASRCISYLTIELKGSIPRELRSGMDEWIFGCDICQDVCPWNSKSPQSSEPGFTPRQDSNPLDLAALFYMDDVAFRARFRNTPLWRPRRRGLLRNAAIALGNRPASVAVPALVHGLSDAEPLVRSACAWALGENAEQEALRTLIDRLAIEEDPDVIQEIQDALMHTVDSAANSSGESAR
jgi:epoxyqueuosine reductase